MIDRIITYLKNNYFGEDLPFEYRLACIFFITAFILSILSLISNIFIGLQISQTVVAFIFIVMCSLFAVSPLQRKEEFIKPLLLFVTFIYLPYMFIQTAGINGTILLFMLLSIFMNAIIFKGRICALVVAVSITIYAFGCILIIYMPGLFIPYPDQQSRVLDFCVSWIMTATAIAIMTVSIVKSHARENAKTKTLLMEIEITNKALADLSIRDPLTGIFNRRCFMSFLETEMLSSHNNGNSICLIMMDIDHFKRINDTFGHGFGDEVLIQTTKAAGSHIRSFDMLARYGGEEFVVVLPNCTAAQAVSIAERIRRAVADLTFRYSLDLTISLGVACSNKNESPGSLIQRADKALYIAKGQGRNQTIFDEIHNC